VPHPTMDDAMHTAIDDAQMCATTCWETVSHCLSLGGPHAEASHIRSLIDCAEVCRAATDSMARGSELHGQVCAVCAEACRRCAESCERVDAQDEQMRACVDACRRCERACRQMAGMPEKAA
jgi:hypothetical protein